MVPPAIPYHIKDSIFVIASLAIMAFYVNMVKTEIHFRPIIFGLSKIINYPSFTKKLMSVVCMMLSHRRSNHLV